jgi:ribosomal protein S8E
LPCTAMTPIPMPVGMLAASSIRKRGNMERTHNHRRKSSVRISRNVVTLPVVASMADTVPESAPQRNTSLSLTCSRVKRHFLTGYNQKTSRTSTCRRCYGSKQRETRQTSQEHLCGHRNKLQRETKAGQIPERSTEVEMEVRKGDAYRGRAKELETLARTDGS